LILSEQKASVEFRPNPAGLQNCQPVSAVACGKTIIVGEHAVVYGAKAVAMPLINLAMGVSLTPLPTRNTPVFKAMIGGRNVSDHVMGVIEDAFRVLKIQPFSLELEGSSTILVGAGLGSSASLCVVVLKAIAASVGRTLQPYELAKYGNELEKRFHGNPSGLDTAVVAYEEVVSFIKGETPVPIKVNQPTDKAKWWFAIIDSCTRSSTISMIKVAEPWFKNGNIDEKIQKFNAASEFVIKGLAEGDAGLVKLGMATSGELLKQAGVVNQQLQDLIDGASQAGCLAAKTTGAGGGGCVLALLDPIRPQEQLAALKNIVGANRVTAVTLP
jgi:mevalonate kinase